MAYEYVMQTLGKNFTVGQRVRHRHMGGGEIKPESISVMNMVMVQIDGVPFAIPCDPWDLEKEK